MNKREFNLRTRRILIAIISLLFFMNHGWSEDYITVEGKEYKLENIYSAEVPVSNYYKVCKNGKYAVAKDNVLITPFKYKDIICKSNFPKDNPDIYVIGVLSSYNEYDIEYEPPHIEFNDFLSFNGGKPSVDIQLLPHWHLDVDKHVKKGEWITKKGDLIPLSEKYGFHCYFPEYYKVPDFLKEKYSFNSFIRICDKKGNRTFYDINGNKILENLPGEYSIDYNTIFPIRIKNAEKKYGLILPDGKILLDCIYDYIGTASVRFEKTEKEEFLIQVRKGEEYGSFRYTKDEVLEQFVPLRPYIVVHQSIREYKGEKYAIIFKNSGNEKRKYSIVSLTEDKVYLDFNYDIITWLDEDENKDSMLEYCIKNNEQVADYVTNPAFMLYKYVSENERRTVYNTSVFFIVLN